jgi:hypothetical protein
MIPGTSLVIPGRRQRARAKRGPMTGSATNPESMVQQSVCGAMDSGSAPKGGSRNDERKQPELVRHSAVDPGPRSLSNSHYFDLKRRLNLHAFG